MPSSCLHGMFKAQAVKTPERTALTGPAGDVSYSELDVYSDRLASLLQRHGVKKDSCVGILMERCNEYALAYVSILKAGGAYLPLDVAYPEGLLADVLSDSSPQVVICKRNFVSRLPESLHVILLDGDWASCLPAEDNKLQSADDTDAEALAYFVYSSGTTGKPKGIACPHRGAVFSYNYRYETIPYANDIEVEACNVFFVWEMFRPLCQGKTLLVIPDNVIYDPPALSDFLEKYKATRMLFTPSLLEAVLDCKSIPLETLVKRLKSISVIILCGEVVTVSLQERVKKYMPWVHLWNLYSVSECHDVAQMELTNGEYGTRKFCPIGKIFKGVDAVVLDENLMPRATGEEGELYVAGPTLAREYLNLPELTASRFPTIGGVRMYKTGDRARVLPNRDLEILGRCDSMQKIRGYSVELHAIESAIMATGMVSAVCVVVQGEEGTDKSVVAYVVIKGNSTCRAIRLELKKKLPHYMVPSYLVQLAELPTHEVSGKLNKKALPPVDVTTGRLAGARERSYSTEEGDCTWPRNDIERALHDLWCETMTMRQIDVVHDSFFDIGGHSLLAAQLVAAIKLTMGTDVGVIDLFTHSTIESLAQFIDGKPTAVQDTLDLDFEVSTFELRNEEYSDIALRAFWRTTHFSQVRARSALLTGATGYLGSYLLFELLSQQEYDMIYCLARTSSTESDVKERVKSSLESKGLWRPEFETKLQVFLGDAALYQMGLDDDDYAFLSSHVDLVLHAAASVNLVYPYGGLRNANVVGTRNIIEFALSGKVKRLGYVSTNGIFPDIGLKDCGEDADISNFPSDLGTGYGQSKWVAEQLVNRARDKGLPVVVFRPGNMGGDSGTGSNSWNPSDFNFLMLTGCVELGAAPDEDDWLMEMTPVDFAARSIINILRDNKSLGKTFHVTNCEQSLTAAECFKVFRGEGYKLEKCSFATWHDKLKNSENPKLSKLRSACIMTTAESLRNLSTFANSEFGFTVEAMNMSIPAVTDSSVKDFLRLWEKHGLISRCPIPLQSLQGKVAIVTGASSGIGAAIAKTLCTAGASVCVSGRRLDRLESLAKTLTTQTGSKVIPFKGDVTSRANMRDCVAECEKYLGPVDILVNNAGVMYYTLMKNMHEDEWEQTIDVNCKGVLNGIAAVLPSMLARKSGHIISISSDAGRKAFPGLSVYSGTKFFVEAVSQGLRLETASDGLKVTTIQPGDCKTELKSLTTDSEAQSQFAQSSDDRNVWLDPEDVASAVLFAASAPSHVGINEVLVEPRHAPA